MEKSYQQTYRRDYAFGISAEQLLHPELEEFFKVDLKKSVGKYNLFDFIGKDIYIELKSRKNTKEKYPTTIIGCNKIKKAEELIKQGNRVIFIFNFTDSLDFWEYTNYDCIKNYNTRIISRNDRPGHKGSDYLEIPIEDLLNMSKK
tara:strand:- start:1108 stop:1545 length:438 start_codon:yes stop_codon:yes gene_type:complete